MPIKQVSVIPYLPSYMQFFGFQNHFNIVSIERTGSRVRGPGRRRKRGRARAVQQRACLWAVASWRQGTWSGAHPGRQRAGLWAVASSQ